MPSAADRPGPSPAQLEKEKEQRKFRRARRKAREAAGEIKELNIVAMMDMMTILLVFLLKSYQASAINVNMGADLSIPTSSTQLHPQENITVTVSLRDVSVNERKVVEVQNGVIPAAAKEGGRADAFYVGALYDALKKEVDKQKYIEKYNKDAPFSGRINVVADKKIAYRTLMEVLYTAGQAELGEYKFMVLKNE
ncbi:MAG TPA: biopolymer transporter ExbD [Anaeromyxobacter sp.]|nr:biopolymer transporter ExbD [Anaeromyxobacter sp.]